MLIRPRLTDYFDLPVSQEQLDFAIPFLDEDIPLFVDPFLLWKSPSLQEQALHTAVIASLNGVGALGRTDPSAAASILIRLSECPETGLGVGRSRQGRRIGQREAEDIVRLFRDVPDIKRDGIGHIEVLQLYVDQVSKDRISDLACGFLKSHLIDYTIHHARELGLPLERVSTEVYQYESRRIESECVDLPRNPHDGSPMLFVPKHWLRFVPWISFDDYYKHAVVADGELPKERPKLLTFNRSNYGVVTRYVKERERLQQDCRHDPLFTQIPVTSAKRKLAAIHKLPSGKEGNADKRYEESVGQLLASLLYPQLDFATEQSRTDSNVLIRDLIFYNGRSADFLVDIYEKFGARQLVFELKNVRQIEREHIHQLNRYLNDELGKLGVLVTRNPVPRSIAKNIIDLWSGQRRAILVLTDADLAQMVEVFDSGQRLPIEVLKRVYLEFSRSLPA